MRALAVSLILAGFMLPAYGAKRVTVASLEQRLAAARNLPDGDLARQLSDLELTERLNTKERDRLETTLPGETSRHAFMVLADASAFLNLPAAEMPDQPTPDVATQRKMLALTVNYVAQTLQHLPNFFATRVTTSFEDSPAVIKPGGITAVYQPIHQVDNSSVTVTFRQGREVIEKSSFDPRIRSLTTSGVFGPILSTVLVDAARSKLAWSHWEQGSTGLRAVFSYEVPKDNSHYTTTHDSPPDSCSTVLQASPRVVAYHGDMAIDPATGTILRLVLLADIKPGEFAVKSGIEVEYGQVSIGGKDYFLPTRSVTSSVLHSLQITGDWGHGQGCPTLVVMPNLQTSLNHVAFENYHVFRSDAAVLTDSEAANLDRRSSPAPAEKDLKQPEESADANPGVSPATTRLSQVRPQIALSSGAAADAAPDSQPAGAPSPNSANAAAAEAITAPASSLPEPSSGSDENSSGPANYAAAAVPDIPVFRTTARQVLVDIVVDKRNGDPVPSLPQSDFLIAEDGKPRTIDFFEEHSSAASPVAQPVMPQLPPGAVTNVPTAPPSVALYVFLLDSLNTEPQNQAYVRNQVVSYLHKMDPGTQVAVFSLGSTLRLLQGFTSDPAKLLAAVGSKLAERDAMAQNRSDNADDAAHIANLQSMRSSPAAIEARQAADAATHAYSFSTRSSMTFEGLSALARYLEGIRGRKNLVWFASSFPVVLFPTPTQLDQLKKNSTLPGYLNEVKQTADLFTLSKIAVYPVSGEGIRSSNIGMADSADAGPAGGNGHFGTAENPTGSLTGEAFDSASATAGMEQLANSTGGRAFSTNDINSALRKIVHDSDVYYTIGYSPSDAATDGTFRRIDVKVAGGKYKLAYRQGYNAADPALASDEDPIAPLLQLGMPSATGILYGANIARTEQPASAQSEPAGQNPELKGPLTLYTVSFTIRVQDVAFNQTPSGKRIARLLIGVKAYGKDGAALNWQANREARQLTPEQYASFVQTGFLVSIDLDLPANMHAQLVTAVYDWSSTRSGTLQIPLP